MGENRIFSHTRLVCDFLSILLKFQNCVSLRKEIKMPINQRALGKPEDKEIHILLEDQQKINQFARLNNRLEELKDDIKSKKTEIQTLEDAGTDMMMLEDDDEKIPYQIGEVFVEMTQDEVQETLDKTKETLEEEVTKLEEKANEIKSQMSDLKTHLYAKFGNAINLENDDE